MNVQATVNEHSNEAAARIVAVVHKDALSTEHNQCSRILFAAQTSFSMALMKLTAILVAVAVALPLVGASPAPAIAAAAPASTSTAKLNTLAKQQGKVYFGSATDNPDLNNSSYVTIFDDTTMFGSTTAANAMKWVSHIILLGTTSRPSYCVATGRYRAEPGSVHIHPGRCDRQLSQVDWQADPWYAAIAWLRLVLSHCVTRP